MNADQNELSHVGILGMKWGHRKAEGNSSLNNSGSKKTTLSDAEIKEGRKKTAKKALIIGTAAVGAGLAVYGGYKVAKFAKEHSKEIAAVKDLVKVANAMGSSKGKSPSKPSSYDPIEEAAKARRHREELQRGINKTMNEIRRESGNRPPIDRAAFKKKLMDTDPLFRKLTLETQAIEAKYGPPSVADLQRAREIMERQGVKFP